MAWPLRRRADTSIRQEESTHACPLPRALALHEVGMWQCDLCGRTWQLVAVAGEGLAPPVLRWAADPFVLPDV